MMGSSLIVIAVFAMVFAIILMIRKFLFFVVQISSDSMLPTLKDGQLVPAVKVRDIGQIGRNDIIVFRSEEVDGVAIKRVIGLPGDIVQVQEDGRVYINGVLKDEPYVRFHGGTSAVLNVPFRKYAVMGDNRMASKDSRHWNDPYVSFDDVEGKVLFHKND